MKSVLLWCGAVGWGLLGLGVASAQDSPVCVAEDNNPLVLTCDHLVPHTSTVPANAGELVHLFVRERVASNRAPGKVVLMIHGLSSPALVAFQLRTDHYDWALWLAQAGLDVFMLDFQGSGLSPFPDRNIDVMKDPCNVPKDQQQSILIPNPLSATCDPSYPFQLINSQSDWSELDTVIDYIRDHRGVDKVALVSWSQGAVRIGPYAVQHPDKVESLLLYAPIYNPAAPSGTGPDGFGQLEDGIQDIVWSATMDNDSLGRTWGPPPAGAPAGSPPEGVMRVRRPFLWGWNAGTAAQVPVPVLVIAGEHDAGAGGVQKLPELYDTLPNPHKMWFKVQCAGHFMVWESQRRVLHHISKEWLTHGAVEGFTTGRFFVDTEGVIHPQL